MVLITDNEGFLTCRLKTCMNTPRDGAPAPVTRWCDHISALITSGEDSPTLWANTLDTVPVGIPYVPTQGLFVVLQCMASDFGSRKVYLDLQRNEDPEFLGLTSEGEGRLVLRSMLNDWFVPRIDYNKECSSPIHGYPAQLRWQQDTDSRKGSTGQRIAQYWSVMLTGQCVVCNVRAILPDAPDLIPDNGRRSGFSSRGAFI